MKISNDVYASLTPPERVRAAISALARNDDRELQRLNETCPKSVYRINDPEYADRMPMIMGLLIAMECDLRGDALDFLIATCQKKKDMSKIFRIITRMATRHAAFRIFAEAEGIDFSELEACGPPRHSSLTRVLNEIATHSDDKEAAEIADELRGYFIKAAC